MWGSNQLVNNLTFLLKSAVNSLVTEVLKKCSVPSTHIPGGNRVFSHRSLGACLVGSIIVTIGEQKSTLPYSKVMEEHSKNLFQWHHANMREKTPTTTTTKTHQKNPYSSSLNRNSVPVLVFLLATCPPSNLCVVNTGNF